MKTPEVPPVPGSAAVDPRDVRLVEAALAEALEPVAPDAERAVGMRTRLLERALISRHKNHGVISVRRDDGNWRSVVPGVRIKLLDEPAGRSVLMELDAGATLPMHRHRENEECVVLRGDVQLRDLQIAQGDFHLAFAGSRHGRVSSANGALLFLRGVARASVRGMVRDAVAAWLPGKGVSPLTLRFDEGPWQDVAVGVQSKRLWEHGGATSTLVRLSPGASLPAMTRTLREESLVVTGEAFVGDLLLRAGEYQRATLGPPDVDIYSDVGAVLYVRGAANAAA